LLVTDCLEIIALLPASQIVRPVAFVEAVSDLGIRLLFAVNDGLKKSGMFILPVVERLLTPKK
jgi:hypothetical protein